MLAALWLVKTLALILWERGVAWVKATIPVLRHYSRVLFQFFVFFVVLLSYVRTASDMFWACLVAWGLWSVISDFILQDTVSKFRLLTSVPEAKVSEDSLPCLKRNPFSLSIHKANGTLVGHCFKTMILTEELLVMPAHVFAHLDRSFVLRAGHDNNRRVTIQAAWNFPPLDLTFVKVGKTSIGRVPKLTA